MSEVIDKELDTSGLSCPLPILRLKRALSDMEVGQKIRVIATDPGSQSDFAAFAAQTGHRLRESTADGGKFFFVIEKG